MSTPRQNAPRSAGCSPAQIADAGWIALGALLGAGLLLLLLAP
jgi:hypothetical protein